MKIAIDVADLDHNRIDGTRVYIKNILKYFGELALQDNFFLFHKSKFNKFLKPQKFNNYQNKELGKGIWWTQLKFAKTIRKWQPDICWMPIQQIPFWRNQKIKYIVTIHDLAFKFFPKHFLLLDRLKINFYTNIAIKRADKIIAISKTTKKDILELYPKINEKKIKVIYHGFDEKNFMRKIEYNEKIQLAQKYILLNKKKKLSDFLLYVGAIQPRKDLSTLIKAFEGLKQTNNNKSKDLKLVLVGENAWKSKKIIKTIENSKFKKDIIIIFLHSFKFSPLDVIYFKIVLFTQPMLAP